MSSTYIFSEVPTWAVDGVNKTFTVVNTIDTIEEIYIAGVPYRHFSFFGTTITLVDAPLTGFDISVDYWTPSSVPDPVEVDGVPFGDIVASVYSRIGQGSSSLQYPLSLIKKLIVEGFTKVDGDRPSPSSVRRSEYSFNKAPDFTTTAYSAGELNGGRTLSTYVPSAGKVLLKNSVLVDYASKSGGALQTLSNLNVVYQSWDSVSIGYRLGAAVKFPQEVLLNWVPLTFADKSEFSITSNTRNYTIINGYIFLPYSENGHDIVTVHFFKTFTTPTLDADVVPFEPERIQVVELYAEYNAYRSREDERYTVTKQDYLEQLRDYKAFLSKQHRGIKNKIPSRGFWRWK